VSERSYREQLYRLLPEVYQSRDRDGDLRGYLDAFGDVLDLLRGVLDQRLADAFPDHPDAQAWTLPYHAELLDARLVSRDDDGRRDEIRHAIAWHQGKGTLHVVEEIAATIGRFGWRDGDPAQAPWAALLVQEGFRRVVTTPRVPLPAGTGAGDAAGTVDLRRRSRRVRGASPDGAGFVQANPAGVPCFPGTSQDLTRRTPDLRAPSWRAGHAHPARVLLFVVPPAGFFPPGWERFPPARKETGPRLLRGAVITGDLEIDPGAGDPFVIEDSIIAGTLHVKSGRVRLARSAVASLAVDGGAGADLAAPPVAAADDCLFGSITAKGLVRLVAVTVLGALSAPRCHASDALLAGSVDVPAARRPARPSDAPPVSAFRFSRVPTSVLGGDYPVYRCVDDTPRFVADTFGARGAGVLHPVAGAALRGGAEDGGEVGAYHHRGYALRERALLDKLRAYLPAGQTAVIVPDDTLRCPPPTVIKRRPR
jgi:hypothetical protein